MTSLSVLSVLSGLSVLVFLDVWVCLQRELKELKEKEDMKYGACVYVCVHVNEYLCE